MKIVLLFFIILLTSCASLNQSECIEADWETIGVIDASNGEQPNYLNQHEKACKKYNIAPSLDDYEAGWDIGVEKFCTIKSGWQYALQRKYYKGTCQSNVVPNERELSFFKGYKLGRQLIDIRDRRRVLLRGRHSLFNSPLVNQSLFSYSINERLELDLLEIELRRVYSKAAALGLIL